MEEKRKEVMEEIKKYLKENINYDIDNDDEYYLLIIKRDKETKIITSLSETTTIKNKMELIGCLNSCAFNTMKKEFCDEEKK